MKDLKIRVNNEAESKEAQELFFELGYNWFKKGYMEVKTPETIMSFENGALSTGIRGSINHKEITLPELRDLVVLERNDVGDATHIRGDGKKYFHAKSTDFFYQFSSDGDWLLSTWMNYQLLPQLQPIEKPMKEYLRKNSDGTYSYIGTVRPEHVSDFMIEIPEGAEIYSYHKSEKLHSFYKDNASKVINEKYSDWVDSKWTNDDLAQAKHVDIIWKRHTLPEELPFIDDEPLQILNDQYAEIEKLRQSHRTASKTSNPTIKETLNQRQSQYGSFEDVAMITEQMVDVMRKGYYENLAYNQKMALYMICSKMARIVNGDPNHKDSWHDIAGYATLIDNELESEKDMPF